MIVKRLYIYRYEIVLITKGINNCDVNHSIYNCLIKTYSRGSSLKQVWILF